MAAHVPKPIIKAITEYKMIFNESFLSSDINIKRTIPIKKAITLIKAVKPPIKTKNSPMFFLSKLKIAQDYYASSKTYHSNNYWN
ncbi:hypothetical protein [Flavobacterium aquidurense]|uniref:hypothetical protein n=1 Tax=Flavobacterium aquidurense TaxID=362413 RepID=UPI0037566CD8